MMMMMMPIATEGGASLSQWYGPRLAHTPVKKLTTMSMRYMVYDTPSIARKTMKLESKAILGEGRKEGGPCQRILEHPSGSSGMCHENIQTRLYGVLKAV